MNSFNFADCRLGMKEAFSTEITEEKMACFRELSGDINPLHSDAQYAASMGFQGRVVYGLLTVSFFSQLAGVFLPGEKSLIQEVEYKFVLPVYIGDRLEVSGEVTGLDDRTKQLFLKVRIRRIGDQKTVVRGKMVIGFLGEGMDGRQKENECVCNGRNPIVNEV